MTMMQNFSATLDVDESSSLDILSLLVGHTSSEDFQASSPRPQKRRKVQTQSPVPTGTGGDSWLTLTRLDIKLQFTHEASTSSATSCIESLEQNLDEHPLSSASFVEVPHSSTAFQKYRISIKGGYGCALCSVVARGSLNKTQLAIAEAALRLTAPTQRTRVRSTFTISKENPAALGGNIRIESATSTFTLKIRLLFPNARSALEQPGLPRKPDLSGLFPAATFFEADPWSPKDFYDHVHQHDSDAGPSLGSIEGLQCNLYPFQQRAVRWLLQREDSSSPPSQPSDQTIQHGFVPFIDGDGRNGLISGLLGLVSTRFDDIRGSLKLPKGIGILAEEMGLGKTVEMTALICANRRSFNKYSRCDEERNLERTGATLIITPPAILQQWKSELHIIAPSLKVDVYHGMKAESNKTADWELRLRCMTNDVILTTYSVLARDIYHAETSTKSLRHEKRYEKRLSPLTQLHWWRVILDEAQLVESGVSHAAQVASLIPRENAWCVSGTPARNAKDLLGLLVFLKYQPFCSNPALWDRLIKYHRNVMWDIFKNLSFRHTKVQVRDEIVLPSQKRIVITVPFTPIEEQNYVNLFQEAAEDCGLDQDGSPLRDGWDPEDVRLIEKMRTWLVRLRQTCLHPEVGGRNRRALGTGKGPLRTIKEVLKVMIDQNEIAIRIDRRILLTSQIRRGQILEHAEKTQEALDIWLQTLEDAQNDVEDCREVLQKEKDRADHAKAYSDAETDHEDPETTQTGLLRQRLRGALEVEHTCVFFVANAYYQLKTKEVKPHQTTAESVESALGESQPSTHLTTRASQFEEQEERFYEKAKILRREMLAEPRRKADECISKVKAIQLSAGILPDIPILKDPGGIQIRQFYDRIVGLFVVLREQLEQVMAWKQTSVKLLIMPLVDEEDSELQGDEYETSTKHQDEVYAYVDALRAIVSDHHVAVSGQKNLLIDHEMEMLLKDAREGKGHCPGMLIDLLKLRHQLKPDKSLGSIKSNITQLRELKIELRGSIERGNTRAAAESLLVNDLLLSLQSVSKEQTKTAIALEKELDVLKETMNARLEYYRHLQSISDTVAIAPFEENMTELERTRQLEIKIQAEAQTQDRISTLNSKRRYLLHLRDEANDTQPQRICIICTSTFDTGVITSCGHVFCNECLKLWWAQHRNCPTCKKHLRRVDFIDITYKPRELLMEEETATPAKSANSSDDGSMIYSGVRESVLDEIKNIDLNGSFGTKIDTLARHLLWIREHDAGAKSIIFSQFRDFLDVLSRAFSQFRIGYASIEKKDGIERFKSDPSIECFFLHAKAHSSGLNLVNATHVFLCEPLINPAIELQAISRVHRIGQYHETTVWMYLVDGTVERSIYDISVQRRMAHLGRMRAESTPSRPDSTLLETQLEAANSAELERTSLSHLLSKGGSGGELVKKEDLWNCFFSSRPTQLNKAAGKTPLEVAHHLGADAAEARMRE